MRLLSLVVFTSLYLVLSCAPSSTSVEVDDVNTDYLESVSNTFWNLYRSVNDKDAFLFFTDPHILVDSFSYSNEEDISFFNCFKSMKSLYDSLPLSFCLCGGDWLNRGDTQENAMNKLLYADKQMNNLFHPYYKMLGNHDTNYQGVISTENPQRGDLSMDFINNMYFKGIGQSFYSFINKNTVYYILDSGVDWETAMNDYRKKQLKWLADSLLHNEINHIILGIHILINNSPMQNNPTPFALSLLNLCEVFNDRKSIVIDNSQYDYFSSVGKIHLLICGHNHEDFVRNFAIPCVGTTQYMKNGEACFDLCILDYDNGYLEMIRVGDGSNRKVKLQM